ncbi:MAG: DNA-formamidopyrimidine glycosylase [Bacillota bacterium]
MPELPEVETVKNTLRNYLIGKNITDIIINYNKIIRANDEIFKHKLINQTFREIDRYGKYLIFKLDDYSLVSHLRMEGKYFIRKDLSDITKHDHIIFTLSDNNYLTYHDVRKFGTMELIQKGKEFSLQSLNKLGPEINDYQINILKLYNSIKKSLRPIKAILLDQTIVAGLGNIYVDETLFLAQIHPNTKANKLTYNQFQNIIKSAQIVIKKAIDLGGTTIRSYQSSLGVDGKFQNELNVHTLVGDKCKICNDTIIKIKVAGRGTYICPSCQKEE